MTYEQIDRLNNLGTWQVDIVQKKNRKKSLSGLKLVKMRPHLTDTGGPMVGRTSKRCN